MLSFCSNVLCALEQVTDPLWGSLRLSVYKKGDHSSVSPVSKGGLYLGVGLGFCLFDFFKLPYDPLGWNHSGSGSNSNKPFPLKSSTTSQLYPELGGPRI